MAQQQSSRLNRLLTLLDAGSTQATRFTAARQIGDIAKSHPQDLNSLLKRAMDRAHRLGQRKVVNVHRLIMRGTLEEKVMSLQCFKVSVPNAVINAENASLKIMNTDQLLDLSASAETSKKGATTSKGLESSIDGDLKLMGTGKGIKAILGGLEELWDQSQYTEEYNLSQFLAKING